MILRYDQGMKTHPDTNVKIIENATRDDVRPGDHVAWERSVASGDVTTALRREGIAHHRDHYGDWCTKGGMWLTDLASEDSTITIHRPAQDLLNRGGTADDAIVDALTARLDAERFDHANTAVKVKRVEALADDMDHDADLLDQTDDLRLHLIAATHREDATRLRTALNGDDQ